MGMNTSVTVTTVRINEGNQSAALKSLQSGCIAHPAVSGYIVDEQEFMQTPFLARALELLHLECEVDGRDLVRIGFAGGKNDMSHDIWPFIEEFVEQGSAVSTLFETGEVETVRFGEEGDGENAEGGHGDVSEEADDFLGEMARRKITDAELDAIMDREGGIDFVDYNRSTPLLVACENYRWSVQGHADAMAEDDVEVLEEAAERLGIHAHNLEIVLRRDPDLTARDKNGCDALGFAAQSRNVEFVDKLLSHGAQVSASTFIDAVNGLSLAVFRKIAENHAQPVDSDLLVHACAAASYEPEKMDMIRHLVEDFGCDVNSRAAAGPIWVMEGRVGRQGTPLMAAALTDDVAAVEYLLSAGADVHALDCYHNTALHYCSGQTWVGGNGMQSWFARDENPQVIEMLLEHGADALARNAAGRTPADLAQSPATDQAQ
ncbi:MAG: ankyrin repeat domain-containing protein [Pseudomonadota bacterium]